MGLSTTTWQSWMATEMLYFTTERLCITTRGGGGDEKRSLPEGGPPWLPAQAVITLLQITLSGNSNNHKHSLTGSPWP